MGSGPWKFVSKTPSKEVVYEAVTEHWRKVPEFKRYIISVIPEESTRIAMFKRGELDVCSPITIDTAEKFKKEGIRLKANYTPTLHMIQLCGSWMTDGPLSDLRIRKAMSLAINREEIAKSYFKGYAKPAAQGFCAIEGMTWGWSNAWKPDPYDPEQAKKLVKEAGYPDKFKNKVVKIFSIPEYGDQSINVMLMLADYWKAIGLQTEIKTVNSNEYMGYFFARASKPTDPIVGSVAPFPFTTVFNNVYHSSNLYTSVGGHSTLNDKKADALYDKLIKELDINKAKKIYQEFESYGHSQYVHFNVVKVYDQTALGPNIGDFTDFWHMGMNYAVTYLTHPKK